jgi:hypothetical protein
VSAAAKLSRENLNARTFRDTAKKAVERYEQRGMVVDAIVWGRIVGEYEAALSDSADLLNALVGAMPPALQKKWPNIVRRALARVRTEKAGEP